MGLRINVDLETSGGPTQELYTRITSINLNKTAAKVKYVVSYWIDKDHAQRFTRTYLEQPRPSAKGIIAREVVYYKNDDSDGEEITLPIDFESFPVSRQEIEVPVFETQPTSEKVPYVSFDEDGNEVTKYRIVEEEKKVEVGTTTEIRHIIDNNKINNLQQFCYESLTEELIKYFPEDSIESA